MKKEPDTDTDAEASQLPELPQLPNLQDLVEMPAKSTPSPESPKASSPNRIKTPESEVHPLESEDWLADVICCGSEPGNYVSQELVALQEFDRFVVEPPSRVNPL